MFCRARSLSASWKHSLKFHPLKRRKVIGGIPVHTKKNVFHLLATTNQYSLRCGSDACSRWRWQQRNPQRRLAFLGDCLACRNGRKSVPEQEPKEQTSSWAAGPPVGQQQVLYEQEEVNLRCPTGFLWLRFHYTFFFLNKSNVFKISTIFCRCFHWMVRSASVSWSSVVPTVRGLNSQLGRTRKSFYSKFRYFPWVQLRERHGSDSSTSMTSITNSSKKEKKKIPTHFVMDCINCSTGVPHGWVHTPICFALYSSFRLLKGKWWRAIVTAYIYIYILLHSSTNRQMKQAMKPDRAPASRQFQSYVVIHIHKWWL